MDAILGILAILGLGAAISIVGALVVIFGMLCLCWLIQNPRLDPRLARARALHLPRATLAWIREDRAKERERHKKEWMLRQPRIRVEDLEGVEHWFRDDRDQKRKP